MNEPYTGPNSKPAEPYNAYQYPPASYQGGHRVLLNKASEKYARGEAKTIGAPGFIMTLVVGVFLLPLGLILAFASGKEALNGSQLSQEGKTTTAKVIDGRASTRKGVTSYHLVYRYTVDGKTYEHDADVGADIYNRKYIGSSIEIKYLPSDPGVSQPVGDGTNYWPLVLALVGFLLALVGLGLIWSSFASKKLYGRLSVAGQRLEGRVVDVKVSGKKNAQTVTTKYAFTAPDGSQLSGEQGGGNVKYLADQGLNVGSRITVVYLDHKQFRPL